MTPRYERWQQSSYQPGDPLVISPDKLTEVFQFQFGGTQPFGCTARSLGDGQDEVFVATYFEPSILRLVFQRTEDGGLTIAAEPIRGVNHGVESVRIFPGTPGGPFGRENRGREVSVTWKGNLWVNRSDRQLFLLKRLETEDGRWTVVRQVSLPGPWNDTRWVHSMRVWYDVTGVAVIDTIEGVGDAQDLNRHRYYITENRRVEEGAGGSLPATNFVYGWGAGKATKFDDPVWYVTDNRCKSSHGIYCNSKLVLEDPGDGSLTGNGICFLGDGTAVITQYGQGFPGPFNGREGRMTIVPARLLQGQSYAQVGRPLTCPARENSRGVHRSASLTSVFKKNKDSGEIKNPPVRRIFY